MTSIRLERAASSGRFKDWALRVGSLPATIISGFDQAVGNARAVGGNAAIANFVAGAYAGRCRFLRQL